jgi:hypothetical protein
MTFIRPFVTAIALAALLATTMVQAAPPKEKSLYERLGGVFAIAAVVDHFSDAGGAEPRRGKDFPKPGPQGLAHEEPEQIAGSQVHANPVGLRDLGRAVQILANKTEERLIWA